MAKLTLTDLTQGFSTSTVARLNANNDAIEAALEKTLSRDGTSPNEMEADLDMNSNQILNLPQAVEDTEPVRKIEFDAGVETASQAAVDAANSAEQALHILETVTGSSSTTIGLPVSASDISTKEYADLVTGGNNLRIPVVAATATVLPNSPSFTAATSTARATLDASTTGSLVIDGVTIADDDRVIVKDEVSAISNNVYVKSTHGGKWRLTTAAELDINNHGEVFLVESGTVNTGKMFLRSDGSNVYVDTVFIGTNTDFATHGELDSNYNTLASATTSSNARITTIEGAYTNASNLSSGTLPDARLSSVVSASTVGDSTHVPVITYDAHGRITSTTTAAVTAVSDASTLTSGTLPAARLPAFGSGDVSFASAGGAGTIATDAVTTSKIIDDAVTYAKMQNVSATNRFLGRITAGAGNTEELTAANAKTILAIAAGDVSGLATSATTDTTSATNITSGTLAAARLATSGVTAATYGDSTHIPVFAVDVAGRVTSVTNTAISAGSGLPSSVAIVAPGLSGVNGADGADDKAAIAALVLASNTIWFFPGTYKIDTNDTWPAGKTYKFFKGAYMKVTTAHTLTIKGTVEAGVHKIFGSSSAGYDIAGVVTAISDVRPEWWGALNDGSTDDLAAFNAMWTCCNASQDSDNTPTMRLSQGSGYNFSNQWTIAPSQFIPLNLIGEDKRLTKLRAVSAFPGTALVQINGQTSDGTTELYDIRMRGFTLEAVDGAESARGLSFGSQDKQIQGNNKSFVSDLFISGFNRGLYVTNTRLIKWERIGIAMPAINDSVGLTLDTVFTTTNVTGTANNGSGKVRLAVASTAFLSTAQQIKVDGIVGTTEANGAIYTIGTNCTIVDGTHIDLTSVTFTNAWVSGGTVGYVVYTADHDFEDIQIVPNTTSTGQINVYMRTSQSCTGIAGIYMDKCTFYPPTAANGVEVDMLGDYGNVTDVWIRDCQIEGSGAPLAGIRARTSNGGEVYDIKVNGCYFSGISGKGIHLDAGAADKIYDWVITGNYFRGVAGTILEASKTNNIVFSNNVITSNPTSGQIVLLADAYGTALVGNVANGLGVATSGYFVKMTGTTNNTGALCNRALGCVTTFESNAASGGQNDTTSASVTSAFANRP